MLVVRFAQIVFLAGLVAGIVFLFWSWRRGVRFIQIERARLRRVDTVEWNPSIPRDFLNEVLSPDRIELCSIAQDASLVRICQWMAEQSLSVAAIPARGPSGSGVCILRPGALQDGFVWRLLFDRNLPRPSTLEAVVARMDLFVRSGEKAESPASAPGETAEYRLSQLRALELSVQRIAHDIRIPVASLSLIGENLGAEWESIRRTEASVHMDGLLIRLRRQIANLELFARGFLDLEKGAQPASEVKTLDVGALWLSLLDAHAEEMKKKSLRLKIAGEMTGQMVRCAESDLVRILENLLSNALKFSLPGGCIWTSVRGEESDIVLDLEDCGPGFTASTEMDPFDLARRNLGRTGTGYGLGLAAALDLAESMNGKLSLANPLHGAGARFLLVLPGAELSLDT